VRATELRRNFAAKRRKTILIEGLNQWLAWPKWFGISGPFCSPTGSNPVGDANLINNLRNCWFWRTTGYATVELLNHSTMCVAFFFRHGFVVDVHRDCVRGMPQQALHYFGVVVVLAQQGRVGVA
jgi:hypothetical protein